MPGSVLLDTNIAVALLAGDDAVRASLNQNSITFLSSIVVGELFYGARKCTRSGGEFGPRRGTCR